VAGFEWVLRLTPLSGRAESFQIEPDIRGTLEEKLRLEEAGRSKGFGGIVDYVRSTTLGHTV
jgi:hypothetical protein